MENSKLKIGKVVYPSSSYQNLNLGERYKLIGEALLDFKETQKIKRK